MFGDFNRMGASFVNENYLCYQADSVTLGKNWDEDPFDIIFVDNLHFNRENINFSDWGQDIDLIENELKIFAE